jgi:hypothetical protein
MASRSCSRSGRAAFRKISRRGGRTGLSLPVACLAFGRAAPRKARMALLPDAEAAEDLAENLFRFGMADDLSDSAERGAQLLGDELG